MIQLMGAVLVAAGAAWMGMRGADALQERAQSLRDMAEALRLLEQDLELSDPTLFRLMKRLVPRCRGPAKELFQDCSQALEQLAEEEFSQSWRRLVLLRKELGEEGQQCLLPLGDTLGQCAGAEQCRTISAVRRRLEASADRAEEDYRRQGKVYRALGLSGGAFLVILLL